ncbi:DNA polymerase IV [compost metagenome]
MQIELDKIGKVVFNRITQYNLIGRTVTLKVKFSDFKQITRSRSFAEGFTDFDRIMDVVKSLLEAIDFTDRSVRLLGISLSNFENTHGKETATYQPRLFP